MKRIFIISYVTIFCLLLIGCGKTTQTSIHQQATKPVDVIRFSEDKKTDVKLDGFNFHSYSIKNNISGNSPKNIWVTYELLKDKEYSSITKKYLDNGYTVLIEGNIDVFAAYDLLRIEEKDRATKGTKENVQTSQTNLHQIGVLLFKDKDFIYGSGMRIEEFSDYYKDLLGAFTTVNKKAMLY